MSTPADIAQINFAKSVGYTIAGSFLWCIILALAGYYLGQALSRFSEQLSSAFDIITIVVIAGIIAGFVGLWYSRRRKRASAKQ
jgi:membrane protein DedA with SNARE-associated domain